VLTAPSRRLVTVAHDFVVAEKIIRSFLTVHDPSSVIARGRNNNNNKT
jgi:hypothetical protein